MKYRNLILFILLLVICCVGFGCGFGGLKPVIYLYPTEEVEVTVKLDLKGTLNFIYPDFDPTLGAWHVEAQPDGTLTNIADGKEYPYLFWDGIFEEYPGYDLSTGFVVEGEKTAEFLEHILAKMGLTPKEYNEFIVFWAPFMKNNPYNLIHFAGAEYEEIAKLTITPEPDSILRVFMVFSPLTRKIEVTPQEIIPFEREGFTVVEWGGTVLNYKLRN
jgi:hypothetical protein